MPSENKHLRGRITSKRFFLSIERMFSEHIHMRFQDGALGFVFSLGKNTTSQEG